MFVTNDGSILYCDRGLNVDDTTTDSSVKNVVDSTTVTSLNELSEVYDRLCLVSVCMYVCMSVYMYNLIYMLINCMRVCM